MSQITNDALLVNRQAFIKRFSYGMGLFIGVLMLYVLIKPWYEFRFAATKSLDGELFLIDKTASFKRGDIVAFAPPKNKYYTLPVFMKYAAAVPGDIIRVEGRDFYVNDMYLGAAKEKSLQGEPLKATFSPGTYEVPAGYYFIWTPHKDSFDSRYADIGLISKDRIIGRATALF